MHDSQNVRYSAKLANTRDGWDLNDWGDPGELCYESITVGVGAYRIFFSSDCWPNCREIQYCDSCSDSHHLFGCIGLKNASYCILNKQYSKEDYEILLQRIIGDMKQRKEYGEFFPTALSPIAYNNSIAQNYFPLTKQEALDRGYLWIDSESRSYPTTKQAEDLPEHITDASDELLKETIACSHNGTCNEGCSSAFRIHPEELQFYRQFGLPLPRLCFTCRNAARFRQMNPLRVWHRICQCVGATSENGKYTNTTQHFHKADPCQRSFETSYSPERAEIVYCEQCYQAEVS